MNLVDQKYYESVPERSIAEQLMILARKCIFYDFMARMQPSPSDCILDVGISDVINDGANMLEQAYPQVGAITACGLGWHCFQKCVPGNPVLSD